MDYEGTDVQGDFMCNFRIGYTDVFGSTLTHDLKEGGENQEVTNENRKEYVNLYSDFILNKSVERQVTLL